MKEFIHVNKIHHFSNTLKVSDALKGAVFADRHNNYSEENLYFELYR